jgi:hypothetical protein
MGLIGRLVRTDIPDEGQAGAGRSPSVMLLDVGEAILLASDWPDLLPATRYGLENRPQAVLILIVDHNLVL